MAPRIVTLDIETAPLESYHWGLWDQTIGLEQVQEDWTILAFAAKVLGEKKVTYHDTGGRGKAKVRDDLELCKRLWDVLDAADIVVTQNGKAFDIPRINARFLVHGLPPYSPIRVIDTKIAAAKHFSFISNKLEYLTKKLTKTKKLSHKRFPGFKLWVECLKDNPAAWREMKLYNCADVVSDEELYLVLRPWIEGHPNIGTYADSGVRCSKCGSTKIQARGFQVSQTAQYHRFQCQTCGGWSRSRKAARRNPDGVTN